MEVRKVMKVHSSNYAQMSLAQMLSVKSLCISEQDFLNNYKGCGY